MKKEISTDPPKKRRLLALPFIVLPFLTMIFWALGGGRDRAKRNQKNITGLNLQLPNAQLKDEHSASKLSYYEMADRDSAKWRKELQSDPFLPGAGLDLLDKSDPAYKPYPNGQYGYRDSNEQKVYKKLAELNSHLQGTSAHFQEQRTGLPPAPPLSQSVDHGDVDRLEEMMRTMSSSQARDPEVDQLNGMMDRILDIQHPRRVEQRLQELPAQNKEPYFNVERKRFSFSVSLLDTSVKTDSSGAFNSVDIGKEGIRYNAIEAVIHATQSLTDGAIVKMRLLSDITVEGVVIPGGNFVFGKTSLQGERLLIEIHSIQVDGSLIPVRLSVYDLDGMEGIYVPGTLTRESAKQSAGNSLQSIEMATLDPSFKMQAATAGMNAAKSLLTKRARLVKVIVKAGYRILLMEKK